MSEFSRIDIIGQNGPCGLHYDEQGNQDILMDLIKYQEWTRTTAIYPKDKADIYLALGLSSEAGEVAGKLKKFIRDGNLDIDAFVSELGDVLWYLVRLCDEFGINIHELAQSNYEKLEDRKKRNTIGGSGDTR